MSMQSNIKRIMGVISKAISQAPLDKQPILNNKINRLLEKYTSVN